MRKSKSKISTKQSYSWLLKRLNYFTLFSRLISFSHLILSYSRSVVMLFRTTHFTTLPSRILTLQGLQYYPSAEISLLTKPMIYWIAMPCLHRFLFLGCRKFWFYKSLSYKGHTFNIF